MQEIIDTVEADDGFVLRRYRWLCDHPPRGTVQILHGLAEHAGRYARLAQSLTAAGWHVVAHDHRGHGESIRTEADIGHFADHDGWQRALKDIDLMAAAALEATPDLPLVLLGHSMGSSLAIHTLSRRSSRYTAGILSGQTGIVGPMRVPGLLIAKLERLRLGPRGHSKLLHTLSFGSFNRAFKPTRTEMDWLSRDPAEVDKYVDDPRCGFIATTQHWCDHLVALGAFSGPAIYARMSRDQPIYVVAGTQDPVSGGTKQIKPWLARAKASGLSKITARFWPDARHELFNEINRDEITAALLAWLDDAVG